MKPPTVFLGDMTSPEVEAFLAAGHDTVIVPTGSTEQHGPHGPLLTDVLVPTEVARPVAPRTGALLAPAINYGLSYPHPGFVRLVQTQRPPLPDLRRDRALAPPHPRHSEKEQQCRIPGAPRRTDRLR